MQIIGDIIPKFDDDGEVTNPGYAGGVLVQLSRSEARILAELKLALDGHEWDYSRLINAKLSDYEISEVLLIIRVFIEAKFAINQMKNTVDELENILTGLEE